MMRAPVWPNGCPSAIAPPCGLSLSENGSTPTFSHTGITCAANASFSSIDVDVVDLHVRLRERLLHGLDRTDAHDARVEPGHSRSR